jgi:hypothetical protein
MEARAPDPHAPAPPPTAPAAAPFQVDSHRSPELNPPLTIL